MSIANHRLHQHRAPIEEDDVDLREVVRKALGLIAVGFLAMMLLGAGVTVYVAVTSRAAAEAPRTEILGGQCAYGKVGNYVWYNEHYQYAIDMSSGCGMLAVSRIVSSNGSAHTGWRLAWVDMGSARTNAVFPMLDAEQETVLPDGSNCNASTWNGCIGRGIGVQTARGISAGILGERELWGARLGAELGLFVYEGRWRVAVTPEAPSSFRSWAVDWRGYQATPFVGATIRYSYAMAMVRAYSRIRAAEHGCVGCSGVAGKTATQALLGLSIPF